MSVLSLVIGMKACPGDLEFTSTWLVFKQVGGASQVFVIESINWSFFIECSTV